MKIDVLIYSKDRTSQLDLLIRSLKKNFENLGHIYVLNDYSNLRFKEAFDIIADQDGVTFIPQIRDTFASVIRDTVTNCISTEFILPLCDDDFMLRKTDLSDIVQYYDDDTCGINLRYHENMCINYLTQEHYHAPVFLDHKYLRWNWTDPAIVGLNWAYPYQAGSEVYKSSQFKHMLDTTEFVLPNTMEGAICSYPWGKNYLMAFRESRIINISVNKVQTENSNRGGWDVNYTVEDLNEKFLSGQRIDIDYCETYCKEHNRCEFIEMSLEFKEQ